MNQDHTEIIIVLDRSGSMNLIKNDMEGGLNQFFEEQKKEPGRATVTLTQFDTEYDVVYSGIDIQSVPKAELVPRGGTALLDAVGRTIHEVGSRLSKTPEADRPGRVIFLIITDGQENSSREFTSEQVKALIKEQIEKYSWQFVYLGANQDAFAEAGHLGINIAVNYKADSAGARGMTSGMSAGVKSYRKGKGYN